MTADASADVAAAVAGLVDDDRGTLVHVDCDRCRSRLEVRVPSSLRVDARGVAVRCGACETLLQVAVPPLLSPSTPGLFARGEPGDGIGLAPPGSLLSGDRVSGGGGDDDDGGAGAGVAGCGPGRSRASNPEHERHLRLARYHMDMAAQHSNPSAGHVSFPAMPATSPLAQLSLPPCEHESDERVDRVLRAAAHEFWWNPSEIPHRGRRDDDDDYYDANPRHQKILKRERKPRDPSPYNVFIREEIPRLKEKDPGLNHRDAFKAAAKNWAHSPLNMRSPAFVPGPTDRPAERDDDDDERRAGEVDEDDSAAARAEIMRKLQPILQSTPTREEGTDTAAAAAGRGDGDRANEARESTPRRDSDRDEDADKTSAGERRGTSSHRTKSSEHSTECKEYTSC